MLYKDDQPSVEVGVCVDRAFARSGRVEPSALPAGRAATAVARGAPSPEGLARAHAAVHEWCAANGHALTGVRWEIYGHWLDDQDPALNETEVYWLVAGDPVAQR
jgi:effector-binding domain-containing protein